MTVEQRGTTGEFIHQALIANRTTTGYRVGAARGSHCPCLAEIIIGRDKLYKFLYYEGISRDSVIHHAVSK